MEEKGSLVVQFNDALRDVRAAEQNAEQAEKLRKRAERIARREAADSFLTAQADTLLETLGQALSDLKEAGDPVFDKKAIKGGLRIISGYSSNIELKNFDLAQCTPKQIREMPGYKKLYDLCASEDVNLDISIMDFHFNDAGARVFDKSIRISLCDSFHPRREFQPIPPQTSVPKITVHGAGGPQV